MTKSKQDNPSTNFFTPARNWLIASTVVSAAFVVFVAATTSLGFYTIPHAAVVLVSIIVLLMPRTPKPVFYIVLTLSALAALAAIFLTLSFANYYQQRVDY